MSAELNRLGARDIHPRKSRVQFKADDRALYMILLNSRLASRILMPLKIFPVTNDKSVYQELLDFPWAEHMDISSTFMVQAISRNELAMNERYQEYLVKDAIVDSFMKSHGKRPSVETKQPDVYWNISLGRKDGTLSLDLSGDSLHKRGYREGLGHATLKENLAAAILSSFPWRDGSGVHFVDWFCGSGTFLLEAAMMVRDIRPSRLRKYFGIKGWEKFNEELFDECVTASDQPPTESAGNYKFTGSDMEQDLIYFANKAAEKMKLGDICDFRVKNFDKLDPADYTDSKGWIFVNPPYGRRLDAGRSLNRQILTFIRNHCRNWNVVLLYDEENPFGREFKAESSIPFMNGRIPVWANFYPARGDIAVVSGAGKDKGAAQLDNEKQVDIESFTNRIRKNVAKLKKSGLFDYTDCVRVYDKDIPEFGVSVDLYGGDILINEYKPPEDIPDHVSSLRFELICAHVRDAFDFRTGEIFTRLREAKGRDSQYEMMSGQGRYSVCREGKMKLLVNLSDYLDTGLFLDQRSLRRHFSESLTGKTVLNLFAYTGSASLASALSGAETVSVDHSNTYCDWMAENFELNGLNPAYHEIIREECLTFLERTREKFDTVFVAPPIRSRRQKSNQSFEIINDHPDLIRACARVLKRNGEIYFSSPMKGFRLSREILDNFAVEDLTKKFTPPDFARPGKMSSIYLIQTK